MTTVTGTLTAPGGERPTDATVVITLVDLAGDPVAGYTTTREIVGTTTVTPDTTGAWSAALAPTADITSPRGSTLYRVQEHAAQRRVAVWYISVPATGTHHLSTLLVTPPGGATHPLTGYLPLSGGTMTGPIVLPDASPAASEAYVNAHGGGSGGGFHLHTQAAPSTVWTITHTLGYRPNVAVADADGNQIDAAIAWPTTSTVTVSLSAATSGTAYLS